MSVADWSGSIILDPGFRNQSLMIKNPVSVVKVISIRRTVMGMTEQQCIYDFTEHSKNDSCGI
jgi:hypothetical protein